MTDITSAPSKIQEEEVAYKAAVSEATFTKIGAAINYIQDNASDYIGQLECTMLTEAQFATIKGYDYTETDLTVKKWVIVDGQDITGSDYETLTGISTLASAKTNGAFPRQSDSDANINGYQSNQNLSHTHIQQHEITGGGVQAVIRDDIPGTTYSGYRGFVGTAGDTSNDLVSTQGSGGSEARPNTWKINYFLRLNA